MATTRAACLDIDVVAASRWKLSAGFDEDLRIDADMLALLQGQNEVAGSTAADLGASGGWVITAMFNGAQDEHDRRMSDMSGRPRRMPRHAAVVIAAGAMLVGGCTPDPENHDVADGVVCGFLGQQAVEEAIGADVNGLEVTGYRDERAAQCQIATVDGAEVLELWADEATVGSPELDEFARVIGSSFGEQDFLTDDVGWTVTSNPGTATSVDTSGARLLHGGWALGIDIYDTDDAVPGPELEREALRLLRVTVDALDLPDGWPYNEPPPDPIPEMWDEDVWSGVSG